MYLLCFPIISSAVQSRHFAYCAQCSGSAYFALCAQTNNSPVFEFLSGMGVFVHTHNVWPRLWVTQSGKPAHEGSFHFASRFTGERTISAKNYNDVYEGSCILSFHQFIEISIVALKKKIKHFDVAPPVKLCAPAGLPARRRRNYRAN